jgi:hypothetical protein
MGKAIFKISNSGNVMTGSFRTQDEMAKLVKQSLCSLVMLTTSAVIIASCCLAQTNSTPIKPELTTLERSYWVHASLAFSSLGYWGNQFSKISPPSSEEIKKAADLLCNKYGANRLYLFYHREIPIAEARRVFTDWRKVCPASMELVPALLLTTYDKAQTSLYPDRTELQDLIMFLKRYINQQQMAVFDVYPNRDQGRPLDDLTAAYPAGLVRLGIQPNELPVKIFTHAVQDTWSAFCHGLRNQEDWLQTGFGAGKLQEWVNERNPGTIKIAWDLIVVAWDYSVTKRGEYPGYDDAGKNMPLPAGRNQLAAEMIHRTANPRTFAGFSADLTILEANSLSSSHDGTTGSFYQTLKRGEAYKGYYHVPFDELTGLFRALRQGQWHE